MKDAVVVSTIALLSSLGISRASASGSEGRAEASAVTSLASSCETIAAWKRDAIVVNPQHARLVMGGTGKSFVAIEEPCSVSETSCYPATRITTGEPLEAECG